MNNTDLLKTHFQKKRISSFIRIYFLKETDADYYEVWSDLDGHRVSYCHPNKDNFDRYREKLDPSPSFMTKYDICIFNPSLVKYYQRGDKAYFEVEDVIINHAREIGLLTEP